MLVSIAYIAYYYVSFSDARPVPDKKLPSQQMPAEHPEISEIKSVKFPAENAYCLKYQNY